MEDPDVQLGGHINALRGYKICTQAQLGAAIGVNASTMGRKLRGEVGISFKELLILADFFELAVEDLIPPRYAGERKLVRHVGLEPTTRWFAATPALRLVSGGTQGAHRAAGIRPVRSTSTLRLVS